MEREEAELTEDVSHRESQRTEASAHTRAREVCEAVGRATRGMDREEARRQMAGAQGAIRLRASSRSMPRVARPTASQTSGAPFERLPLFSVILCVKFPL